MNGERQFTESPGCVRIDLAGFDAAARAFEAQTQSDVLILISKHAKKSPDLLRAPVCLPDDAQRRGDGDFFRQRGLEQSAVELPATLGPLGVDAATAILAERGARLREAGFRLEPFDGKAERRELLGIVARLQLDIPEEHAVAAHAAAETEGGRGKHKVQSPKLKGKSKHQNSNQRTHIECSFELLPLCFS